MTYAIESLHSPRIRGDDPSGGIVSLDAVVILPVFAGMIRPIHSQSHDTPHSPRIRGDDPGILDVLSAVG